MGILDSIREWGAEQQAKYDAERANPSAELPEKYKSKYRQLPKNTQLDIDRYLQVFNNDVTPVLNFIDELVIEGKSDYFKNKKRVKDEAHPKDLIKFSDLEYLGKTQYDMMYRKDTENAKRARKKVISHPLMQPAVGISTGLINTATGITEMAAALSDLALDTDTLSTVEKVMPAIDLMDIYGDKEGSIAKFTSILTQYGTGFGIARKISSKLINTVAKRKLAQRTAKTLAATKTGDKALRLAKFGGYWVLPAALGDSAASNRASRTIGDAFGDEDATGFFGPLQRALANSQQESLEGLTGKERAAASLRNKLKFGAEGTALMGSLTLVGPGLKGASWLAGKGLVAGDTVLVQPGMALLKSEKTGLPQLFRSISKGKKKFTDWAGIPKYETWKFSDWNAPFWNQVGRATEALVSRFTSNFKFDPASANSLRRMQNEIRKIKKGTDLWMKQLDRNMYGLVKAGFNDIMFNTQTAQRALSYWEDVLQYLRGNIKLDKLPKSLRIPSHAIRNIIDEQTKLLQPIIRDMDVRDEMIKNMGRYLHTSYQIFKNPSWRAPKETYENAVKYFEKLIRDTSARGASMSKDDITRAATQKVNRMLEKGRTEGSTPMERLNFVASAAQSGVKIPAHIFKDLKNLPDEIAELLGKVQDPKQIIMDTIVEQAHTIHSYNAYRDLAKNGLGKWLFRNNDEYHQYLKANKVNPKAIRDLKEVNVSKPYNMDLEDIFVTGTGRQKEKMLALPEMAEAINSTTVMMDQLLKFPMMKSLLGIKAATQINKTVLSIMTQMRNITTASLFALANGHLGKGASVADNFEMLFKDLIGKTKDPKKLREALEEALEAGALDSSTIAQELEQIIPELMGPSKWNIGKTGQTSMQGKTSDQIMEWLFTNKGPVGKVVQKAIEAYQLGDNVWKMFGYNFTKSQLQPAFKNLNDVKKYFREVEGYEWNPYKAGSMSAGTNGRNLKTLEDAKREVAGLIVRDTYPNYSMVPRFVQNVRKFPLLGNFVGFTSEMWRNSYQIMRRGTKEMASSNPYIRQMGARRLVGFSTTMAVLGPVASQTASYLTGVAQDKIRAWKESFAPEYQEGHRMIPIGSQDKKSKNIKAIDFDAQNPYTDVLKPFSLFAENIAKGPQTDQSTASVWRNAFADSIAKAAEPFLSPSIWFETAGYIPGIYRGEIYPDPKTGISKSKSGGIIADWNNDINPWEKTMYHLYSKVLPTTLKSGEKLWKAFEGQVTKHGIEYDPMEEVSATMAGVRVVNMNGYDGMKFKVNQRAGEMGAASKTFGSNAVKIDELKGDAALISQGFLPEYVPELFDRWQENRYRIWSDTYKDIQNMRTLGYTEKEIKETIEGRQPFGKKDLRFLMKGYYNPANVPNLSAADNNRFTNAIETINRNEGTNYKMKDFFNKSQLKEIQKKWQYIPLGERDIDFSLPKKQRITPYIEDTKELIDLKKKQIETERENKNQSSLPTAPIGTPDLNMENFTASRESPTFSGTVDQVSGLTDTQTALLSPEEQVIARRQNQGLGSLA